MVETLAHKVNELRLEVDAEKSARLALHERLVESEHRRVILEMKVLEMAGKINAVDRLAGQVSEMRAQLVRAGVRKGDE